VAHNWDTVSVIVEVDGKTGWRVVLDRRSGLDLRRERFGWVKYIFYFLDSFRG
jgi:hypothetical protein